MNLQLLVDGPGRMASDDDVTRPIGHEHQHGRLFLVEQYFTLRFGESDMAQALARRVFGRTGGQPLFVVSLIDCFVAQREILEVDGHWRRRLRLLFKQSGWL